MTPPPDSPGPNRVSKLARRPHRKSRNGCFNCKRRKVKCDEVKPACSNCIRFGIPCDFAPHPGAAENHNSQAAASDVAGNHAGEPSAVPRRGPGRPRKDWAALARPSSQAQPSSTIQTSPSSTMRMSESPSATSDSAPCSLNVSDAELLINFISHTATTFHDSHHDDNGIARFWVHNVPMLGISYHFVLHLVYALAAYHMGYAGVSGVERRNEYLSLAEQHSSTGLSELNKVLPHIDANNCGALYISAVLACYCTLAAGPTGPEDLLVCNVAEGAPQRWLPLLHGIRMIRQSFEPATLFSGLMTPLNSGPGLIEPDRSPPYRRNGLRTLDWADAFGKLRQWVGSHDSPNTIMYQRALQGVSDIYEAIYQTSRGAHEGLPDIVFEWLYRMQDPFVACLQRKEPQALIILAYWVPLLSSLRRCWFVNGWPRHLLDSIWRLLSHDLTGWLEWPSEASRQAAEI